MAASVTCGCRLRRFLWGCSQEDVLQVGGFHEQSSGRNDFPLFSTTWTCSFSDIHIINIINIIIADAAYMTLEIQR